MPAPPTFADDSRTRFAAAGLQSRRQQVQSDLAMRLPEWAQRMWRELNRTLCRQLGGALADENTLRCSIDGVNVSMQYDPRTQTFGFYAERDARDPWETALPHSRMVDLNATGLHAPVQIGPAPKTGRLQAVMRVSVFLVGRDAPLCRDALKRIASVVR
jgi:hypothetical protein